MRLLVLLLCVLTPAATQDRVLSTHRQLWDGSSMYAWSVLGGSVTVTDVSKAKAGAPPKAMDLDLPQGQRLLTVVSGQAWTVSLEGNPKFPIIYRSTNWRQWERMGKVPIPEARIRGLFPLSKDRFLMMQGLFPFSLEGKASFIGIFKLQEGAFQLEAVVDLGIDVVAKLPQGSNPKDWEPRPRPGWEESYWDIATGRLDALGGQPALIIASLGKVAIFSSEHGGLLKVVTLYGEVDDLTAKGHRPAWPFLLGRPMPDGALLMAARSEEAVRSGRKIFQDAKPVEVTEGMTPEGRIEAQKLAQQGVRDRVWEAFPDLLWFKLDPMESSFRPTDPPPGLPRKLHSVADFSAFDFTVDARGLPRVAGPVP